MPNGFFVLHKCDNRACVRPQHLFLGTKHDNTWDAISKGRIRNVLSGDQVIEMRRLRSSMTIKAIADKFGVAMATAQKILEGKRWKFLLHDERGLPPIPTAALT